MKEIIRKINYFSAPLAWDKRLGNTFSRHFAELCSRLTEYLPQDTLKSMRAPRLKHLVRHANERVPVYANHYKATESKLTKISSEDDLFLLPPISKRDFKKYSAEGLSCRASGILPSRAYAHTTSGSTGEPFLFFLDTLYGNEKTVLRYRYWERAGVKINEPKIFCAPESSQLLVPNLIFFHPHFLRARKKEYIEKILTSGAKVLFGFPLLVFDLLWMLAEENVDVIFNQVILSGHAVSPGIRSFFKKRFLCDTFEYYGTTETGSIAAECKVHSGLHINEENTIVEIVDGLSQPVPVGVIGKVLVTTLSNDVMPFIRYDTGDVGVILPGTCPCGRTSRRIMVEGRDNEYLLLGADGESISPSILREVLDEYFEYFHRYQVVQNDFQTVAVCVVPTSRFRKIMEREIAEKIQKVIPSPINIKVECVDFIPPLSKNGKFQYFVSDLWSKKFPDGIFTVAPLEKR